ncbi:ABC transporter permease [Enterobacter asburiae]
MQLTKNTSIGNKHVVYDVITIAILTLLAGAFFYGWQGMHSYFNGRSLPALSTDYRQLPYYTLRTTMRLCIGLVFSLIFTLIFGVLAEKFAAMRRVILPFVNFMESVPLVGFLTFTTAFFLGLFPHSVMGLEGLAIFAVFTGQVWNMMLTLYQTLRVVPHELKHAAAAFRCNPWQCFWRLGFLYSVPGLLWNTMVSQSAAWFALIASEMLTVGNNSINLPGIGSWIGGAIDRGNVHAVVWGLLALVINIVLFDQLLFRPLVRYASRFKYEDTCANEKPDSWFYSCLAHSVTGHILGKLCTIFAYFWLFMLPKLWYRLKFDRLFTALSILNWLWSGLWYLSVVVSCLYFGHRLWFYLPLQYLPHLPAWMGLTAARVIAAMLLSIVIFTPLGVWIGLRPGLVRFFQPIIQVMAAIPANVFYPVIAVILLTWHQDLNAWTIPMIMLGTQWYVLFNVIAGASVIPAQMTDVSRIFRVGGILWWTKYILPAIFPYLITGIISAAGGAWNAAIAAEVLKWGNINLKTEGLGAFISTTTAADLNPEAALGCLAMCFMVALCVIFIWQPLYRCAETRFKFD